MRRTLFHLRLVRLSHILALACALLATSRISRAQTASASEDDIRAAMITHLPLFVEWPAGKIDPAHPLIHVCLLGTDPIGPALEAAFRAATTLPFAVQVSHVSIADKLDECHLLYVGASVRGSLTRLAPELTQAAVLIVSERPIDAEASEVIGLPLEDNHVRVEVNLIVAQRRKLTISSRLLRLAAQVKQP